MPRFIRTLAWACWLLAGIIAGPAHAQSVAWQRLPSPPGNSSALAASPTANHLYMTTYLDGIYRSADAGLTWQSVYRTAADQNFYAVAVRPDGVVFAGGVGAVFRSVDAGATWSKVSVGSGQEVISSLAFDAAGRIYAGTRTVSPVPQLPSARTGAGVFRSADNGQTWSALNAGLVGTSQCVGLLHSTPTGQIYLGLHDQAQSNAGGIFQWNESGATWQALPLLLISGTTPSWSRTLAVWYVYALAAHQGALYAAIEGSANRVLYRLLVKSTDGGNTWQREFVVPENPTFSEQPHPFRLFVATRTPGGSPALLGHMSSLMLSPGAGVYRLQGSSWQPDAGQAIDAEQPLHFAETASGQLFALEENNQSFFATSPVTSTKAQSAPYNLMLAPNPAPSGTTIFYRLPGPAQVSISITDALGRRIEDQDPHWQATGPHQYTWLPSAAAPGLYLVTLQVGATRETQRLLVQ